MEKYFKIVDNFLPSKVFDRLLKIVEGNTIPWIWSDHSYKEDNLFMLSLVLFNNIPATVHPWYPAFQVIEDFQAEIVPFKQVLKSKINLSPNQGKNVPQTYHKDIVTGEKIDDCVMTSVFNFHTCNGGTMIKLDEKEEKISSKANRLILFDNTFHHGITQSDIPRRIVLNLNVIKL